MLRLYVVLRNGSEDRYYDEDENVPEKLRVKVSADCTLNSLKHVIEKEVFTLSPKIKNFVCLSIEDDYGYKLTQSQQISDFVNDNDRIKAVYSDSINSVDHMLGSSKAEDLIPNLTTYVKNMATKLKTVEMRELSMDYAKQVIEQTLAIGFSTNQLVIRNYCEMLIRLRDSFDFEELFNEANKTSFLLFSLLEYWLYNFLEENSINHFIVGLYNICLRLDYIFKRSKESNLISLFLNKVNNYKHLSPKTKKEMLKSIQILSKGRVIKKSPKQALQRTDSIDELRYKLKQKERFVDIRKQETQSKENRGGNMIHKKPLYTLDIIEKTIAPLQTNNFTANTHENQRFTAKTQENWRNSDDGRLDNKYEYEKDDPNSIYREYLVLLTPQTETNLLCFAIKSLEKDIEMTILDILGSKKDTLRLMTICKLSLGNKVNQEIINILEITAKNMNEERAVDIVEDKLIPDILTSIEMNTQKLQLSFLNLLNSIFYHSKYSIDINTIFQILQSNIDDLKMISASQLKRLTDNVNNPKLQGMMLQMEHRLKEFTELLKTRNINIDLLENLIEAYSNICIIDYLKPQIIYMEGDKILIQHLRDQKLSIKARRAAIRGLFKLSTKNRDLKIRILSDLSHEIRLMRNGMIDPVIKSLLLSLVRAN